MIIKQISVFLENRPGTLFEVLEILSDHAINLRAMAVADTSDFGILRLVVNDPDKVVHVLREASYAVKTTPVLGIQITDRPGGLLEIIRKLTESGINIEYVYAFGNTNTEGARVVLKVDDLEKAVALLGELSVPCAKDEKCDFYW